MLLFLQGSFCTFDIDLSKANTNFCVITCILTRLSKSMPKTNALPRSLKYQRFTCNHRRFEAMGVQIASFIFNIDNHLVLKVVRK